MKTLSSQQVQQLTERLHDLGFARSRLHDEFLDHWCCAVETAMANGQPFDDACKTVLERFGKAELKLTEHTTLELLHATSFTMRRIALLTLAVLLLTAVVGYCLRHAEPYDYSEPAPTLAEAVLLDLETPDREPPSGHPLDAADRQVSSAFGMRIHPVHKQQKMHTGIDFRAPTGTPVYATGDGTVRFAANSGQYGNRIDLEHDSIYTTRYAHLDEILVEPGETVRKGDLIGRVGNTGPSTAPHLHYEVRKNKQAVNPQLFFP